LNKTLKERQATQEKVHDVSVPSEKRSFPDRKTFTWEKVNYVPFPYLAAPVVSCTTFTDTSSPGL
jgi:hypothetical protein